ncbi:MAG: DinB family protein [Chloroflexi bacterium]|jgi:hypothetical protein|nr:DinB family protein [Chloroflexota bacterium]
MNSSDLKASLWSQFGASIDMFTSALRACPGDLWQRSLWEDDRPDLAQFWYLGYHALFWLDLYLSGAVEGFAPPPPFTLDELDPTGILPDPPCSQEQLLAYAGYCREKCCTTLAALTEESAARRCRFPWGEISFAELCLYNLRHIQEHAAQMNLFLGQNGVQAGDWVAKAT